jgi:hypothetical protein
MNPHLTAPARDLLLEMLRERTLVGIIGRVEVLQGS